MQPPFAISPTHTCVQKSQKQVQHTDVHTYCSGKWAIQEDEREHSLLQ